MRSTDYELPDDGLCKPKHAGPSVVILEVFNSLTFCKIVYVCISWTNKGFDIINMRGATMKIW